eukprot:gene15100-20002_t
MSEAGQPIVLLNGGGKVVINADGTINQGTTALGRLSVQKFADNSRLVPIAGGFFTAPEGVTPERVDDPELLQGYLEGSNIAPLREMVDLVLINRAYEANQKIITSVDQQMQKTLDALDRQPLESRLHGRARNGGAPAPVASLSVEPGAESLEPGSTSAFLALDSQLSALSSL